MSILKEIKKTAEQIRRKKAKRVEDMIDSMKGMSLLPKTQRSFIAEEKALKAAKYWAGQNLIRMARLTKRLSPEDMSNTDLVITLNNGQEIKVQVKNYSNYLVYKNSRNYGTVPFIIWPDDGEDIAKERMLNLIMAAYFADLTPYQLRQTVKYIAKLKQLKQNIFGRILSHFRKAS